MGKKQSLRSKAVHLVSDLTTVLLNPISDNNNNNHNKPFKPSLPPSIIRLARKLPTGDVSAFKAVTAEDEEEPLDENDLT